MCVQICLLEIYESIFAHSNMVLFHWCYYSHQPLNSVTIERCEWVIVTCVKIYLLYSRILICVFFNISPNSYRTSIQETKCSDFFFKDSFQSFKNFNTKHFLSRTDYKDVSCSAMMISEIKWGPILVMQK
jgi:hypothetical protein